MKQNKGRNLSVLVFLRLSPSCQHCDFTCIICSGAMESFECHGKMHAKECVAATTIQISQISHTCSSFFSVRLVAAVHLNNLCECAASTCKLFRIYFPWLCITVLLWLICVSVCVLPKFVQSASTRPWAWVARSHDTFFKNAYSRIDIFAGPLLVLLLPLILFYWQCGAKIAVFGQNYFVVALFTFSTKSANILGIVHCKMNVYFLILLFVWALAVSLSRFHARRYFTLNIYFR